MKCPVSASHLRRMLAQHGVTQTARLLQVRHQTVRAAAAELGYEIPRGRPPVKEQVVRNQAIRRSREMMSAAEVAAQFGLSTGRVHQICRGQQKSQ